MMHENILGLKLRIFVGDEASLANIASVYVGGKDNMLRIVAVTDVGQILDIPAHGSSVNQDDVKKNSTIMVRRRV